MVTDILEPRVTVTSVTFSPNEGKVTVTVTVTWVMLVDIGVVSLDLVEGRFQPTRSRAALTTASVSMPW
jgi:hypothetical protein